MTRLLENRILGGVCSGLGRTTRISPWLWRIAFIVLTPLTGGTAILLYAMLWWLLPEQSFNDIEVGRFLPTIGAFAIIVIVIGGWLLRDDLVSDTGADLYLPSMLVLTSLVFLLQQFKRDGHTRTNPVLGLVAVAISGFFLVGALGTLSIGVYDTVSRALPAILIFLGLSLILRERFPIGGLIALAVSLALPVIIATVAFSGRVGQILEDNVVLIEQPIDESATQMILDLTALSSDVEIRTGTQNNSVIAEFKGSTEHNLQADFALDDNTFANLVLVETQVSQFSSLTAVGRGTIDVQLPPNFPVFIKLSVRNGDVTLNLRDLDLLSIESLTIDNGNSIISLPAYAALSDSAQDSGVLSVLNGNLTFLIPDNLGVELFLNQTTNNRPTFDDLLYFLEDRQGVEWRLSQRDFDSLSIQTSYIVSVPSGTVTLETRE